MTTDITENDLERDDLEAFLQEPVSEPEPTPEPEPVKEPSVTGMTLEEMSDTLTGFEELAIAKAFSKPLEGLTGMRVYRALAMIWHKRGGDLNDADAYQTAMDLRLKDVVGYFDDDDEITPDTPETESGKD